LFTIELGQALNPPVNPEGRADDPKEQKDYAEFRPMHDVIRITAPQIASHGEELHSKQQGKHGEAEDRAVEVRDELGPAKIPIIEYSLAKHGQNYSSVCRTRSAPRQVAGNSDLCR
jgi:hypothetical protein